jgi:hypothetical protein
MTGSVHVADDVDVIKAQIDRFAHERRMAPMAAGCRALVTGSKVDCEQCIGVKCLLCKTYQEGNQGGAKGCMVCDTGDGKFKACPT